MTDSPVRPLTPRQWQVVHAIGEDLSYSQIGRRLGITSDTVRNYVKAIVLKLPPAPLPPRELIARWVEEQRKAS